MMKNNGDASTKTRQTKENLGFTLAEVLITLGIIGVVAAMTIPNLINNYKAKRLHSQFLKSYSTIQQVMKMFESEDLSTDPKDYPSSTEYSKTFAKFLQAPLDCTGKTSAPCYGHRNSGDKMYKTLTGQTNLNLFTNDHGTFVLQDGTTILMDYPYWVENGQQISGITIGVDLNGFKNKPNRVGYDLFVFQFVDGELVTGGDSKSLFSDMERYCDVNSNDPRNGAGCAQKAKENTDYFKALIKKFK